ncbi:MAG: hypothetical protein II730_10150, partial [Bacteroidales bacterium]|nr:hypothetical protein [Bacteroidales bacterium]
MGYNNSTTVITLSGSKVGLVKMLNAALRGVGADIVLADTEDGESILRKLNDNNIVFQLQDLLNEGDKPLPREGVPVDEECTEYFEDYGLRLADIQQKGLKLTLVFHFWSAEYDLGEWDYESDYKPFFYELLPRYQSEATVIKPQWTVTFWYTRGEVTHYYYEPLAEPAAYQDVLEKLVEINPERYLPFLVDSMKHQISCLQDRMERALKRLTPKTDAWDHHDDAYFKRLIYSIIKDKIFLSNCSSCMATVVKELPEEIIPGLVLFDGIMLYDGLDGDGIEDDIQQMNSFTKDGERVNLEDYYTENGAFDDDGIDRFVAALERL